MSILSKIFNLVNSSSNGYNKNKHRGSNYYKRHTRSKSGFLGSMMSAFSSRKGSYSDSHKRHHPRKKYSSWS
ncbi:hypothetical protein [Clostridium sp. Marseille-Q2269]|uniref:hypothetical protein n=1 Tax=Clostridium sp. Marseille-Q2269 TaxID=2942205 RepID=UPI0020739402|nr:hypothetical protein [Clostridium sp. Marseille-Q2269]